MRMFFFCFYVLIYEIKSYLSFPKKSLKYGWQDRYFPRGFENTKSVLFTSILHGILGLLIFTSGLGQHGWLDMLDLL